MEHGTSNYDLGVLELNGIIELNGKISIGGGSKICTVNKKSMLRFGKNVVITGNCHIVCTDYINIDDECLISWNVQMLDSDHHKIYDKSKNLLNQNKPINISKNVWICSNVSILKGTFVSNDSIISAGSVLNKQFCEENVLIANNEIKRTNIFWKKN